ncbi:MAG: murein biosynthesis integral membrane protein MurJ [Nitrospirae bacterium]|nr:murein biosynthesis integral membrane protein MurJ [Nitrospirota bacterium]
MDAKRDAKRDDKRKVAGAAGRISIATFISRILGYVRDMIFGSIFGAGQVMDAYLVAFRIPNLFREVFAEGSMSAAFVPTLTETMAKDGPEEARRLVRIAFTFISMAAGGVCALGMAFAPQIVTVIAPGFLADPEKFATTITLTRIMFPFLLFLSLAALEMGSLNTKGVFFVPALAPAIFNVVSITTTLFFVSRLNPPILAVAAGVAVGGLSQFLCQFPTFLRKGYSALPLFDFRHPGLRRMLVLMLPVMVAMSTNQVNIFVTNILASYLPEGSITYLYYAMRLIQFPVGIFGVAMATAVLPTLSRQAVEKNIDSLRDTFSFAIRLLFFITLPAMAGLIALSTPIVSTLFMHGKFGPDGVAGTAAALLCYSAGIWSMVGMRVVASTFYSLQDTKTPVRMAMIGMASNICMSIVLMQLLGHMGLALSAALASGIQFTLLITRLRAKIGRVDGRRIVAAFAKTALISAAAGAAAFLAASGGPWLEAGQPAAKMAWLGGGMAVFMLVYFGASRLAGSREMEYLLKSGRRKAE